jgi:hypothetical protein
LFLFFSGVIEMSMEFTMGTGGVPAGNYFAEFVGAEPYLENAEKYGEGVALRFRILGGENDGAEASRICSAKLTPKSALGKFAVALKGSAIAVGEQFSFDAYKGVQGSLVAEPTEGGGTRVAYFLRQPVQQATQPVQPPVPPQEATQPNAATQPQDGQQSLQQAAERF